jgi:hypothetical protein
VPIAREPDKTQPDLPREFAQFARAREKCVYRARSSRKRRYEKSTTPETKKERSVLVDKAVVIQPYSKKEYTIPLRKGQLVSIHARADYPITVELISRTEILKTERRELKTIETERSRTDVKTANIKYEAKRHGTWVVHIHNEQRKLPLEVGVIISLE